MLSDCRRNVNGVVRNGCGRFPSSQHLLGAAKVIWPHSSDQWKFQKNLVEDQQRVKPCAKPNEHVTPALTSLSVSVPQAALQKGKLPTADQDYCKHAEPHHLQAGYPKPHIYVYKRSASVEIPTCDLIFWNTWSDETQGISKSRRSRLSASTKGDPPPFKLQGFVKSRKTLRRDDGSTNYLTNSKDCWQLGSVDILLTQCSSLCNDLESWRHDTCSSCSQRSMVPAEAANLVVGCRGNIQLPSV